MRLLLLQGSEMKRHIVARCLDCSKSIWMVAQITKHKIGYPKHRIKVIDSSQYDKFGFPLDSTARKMKRETFYG